MTTFEQEQKESAEQLSDDKDIFRKKEEITLGKNQKVPVEFLLVAHTPEYAAQIAEATKDANVVAVELVGSTEGDRIFEAAIYNSITHEKDTEKANKIAELAEYTGELSNDFNIALALALQGTDKEIVFVDITKADREKLNLPASEYKRTLSNLRKYLYQNSPESGISELPQILQTFARHHSKREELVVTQIKKIIKEKQSWSKKPLRVAVIQGMIHTPSSHLLSKEKGYDTTRSFVPQIESEIVPKGTKTIYSYLNQGTRMTELAPQKKIPEEMLEKIILEAYLTNITKGLRLPYLDILHLTRRLTDSFNSKERKDIFEHITNDIHSFLPEAKKDRDEFMKILQIMSSTPQETRDEILSAALERRISHSLVIFLTTKYGLPPPPSSTAEIKNFLNEINTRPSYE